MNRTLAWLVLAYFLCFSASAAQIESSAGLSAPGGFSVEVVRYDWQDTRRDCKVPVKIYFPRNGEGPFPVILFSHGLGGTRESYEYLGRHWASHGYVSIHIQHIGSDDAVWQHAGPGRFTSSMRKAAMDLANITNRPLDVSFAIDQAEKLNSGDSPLAGRLDLTRIGAAGHSFGAYTTMAIAGETFQTPLRGEVTFRDPRVSAAIAMSTPVPAGEKRLDQAFGAIKIPVLHMTGTKDKSPLGNSNPAQRRAPYDHIHLADQYLIIFEGGDHMIFSGRGRMVARRKDENFQKLIRATSVAFWNAYLKKQPAATAWLDGGGCQEYLGKQAAYEKKILPREKQ